MLGMPTLPTRVFSLSFFQFIKKSFVSAAIYNVTISLQLLAIASKHSIRDIGSSASFHYVLSLCTKWPLQRLQRSQNSNFSS